MCIRDRNHEGHEEHEDKKKFSLTSDLQSTVRPERSAEGAKSKGCFGDASTSLAVRAPLSALGFSAAPSCLPFSRSSSFVLGVLCGSVCVALAWTSFFV